jgi:hypothetical protein
MISRLFLAARCFSFSALLLIFEMLAMEGPPYEAWPQKGTKSTVNQWNVVCFLCLLRLRVG